jgi:hypothetical protein
MFYTALAQTGATLATCHAFLAESHAVTPWHPCPPLHIRVLKLCIFEGHFRLFFRTNLCRSFPGPVKTKSAEEIKGTIRRIGDWGVVYKGTLRRTACTQACYFAGREYGPNPKGMYGHKKEPGSWSASADDVSMWSKKQQPARHLVHRSRNLHCAKGCPLPQPHPPTLFPNVRLYVFPNFKSPPHFHPPVSNNYWLPTSKAQWSSRLRIRRSNEILQGRQMARNLRNRERCSLEECSVTNRRSRDKKIIYRWWMCWRLLSSCYEGGGMSALVARTGWWSDHNLQDGGPSQASKQFGRRGGHDRMWHVHMLTGRGEYCVDFTFWLACSAFLASC